MSHVRLKVDHVFGRRRRRLFDFLTILRGVKGVELILTLEIRDESHSIALWSLQGRGRHGAAHGIGELLDHTGLDVDAAQVINTVILI